MGCGEIASVTSLNPTPPQLYLEIFGRSVVQNAPLYVPIGSKVSYWLHPYWEDFTTIIEIDPSSVEKVEIDNAEAIKAIYSVEGRKIHVTDISELPKGVYIINGKKRIIK